MKRKATICLAVLCMLGLLGLTGCSVDGDPQAYAGIGIGMPNFEATLGKQAGKSPSRHPSKNRKSSSLHAGTSTGGAHGFQRD